MKLALGALALVALAGSAQAAVWNEVSTGQFSHAFAQSAESVTGTGSLTAIDGDITPGGDFDVFLVYIKDPANFSASTNNGLTTMTDTTLYLFNTDGTGIVKHDDLTNTNFLSGLTNALTSTLAPGIYALAIGPFGLAPGPTGAQSLADLTFDINDVQGQTPVQNAGVPYDSLYNLIGGPADLDTGHYHITLTGTSAIPTPGAVALIGVAGLAGLRRRR